MIKLESHKNLRRIIKFNCDHSTIYKNDIVLKFRISNKNFLIHTPVRHLRNVGRHDDLEKQHMSKIFKKESGGFEQNFIIS